MIKMRSFLFLFFFSILHVSRVSSQEGLFEGLEEEEDEDVQPRTDVEIRSINDTHVFDVSRDVEYYIKFEISQELKEIYEQDPDKHIFQVNFAAINAKTTTPLDVTVRQFTRIISFQLPNVKRVDGELVYKSQTKSVDFCPVSDIDQNSTVLMTLTSSSKKPIKVTVRVLIKGKNADWKIKEAEAFESKTTITPAITRIRYFQTDLISSRYINVKVNTREGSDCLCSLVSIQQPHCPFHDSIGSAMRFGMWSTMLNSTTIIVDSEDYKNGFIIVLVAAATDDLCHIVDPQNRCSVYNVNVTDPRKKVHIRVEGNSSRPIYVYAILTILACYGGIAGLTIAISVINFKYNYHDFEKIKGAIDMYTQAGREKLNQISENFVRKMSEHHVLEGYHIADGLQKALESTNLSPQRVVKDEEKKENVDIAMKIEADVSNRVSKFIDDKSVEEKLDEIGKTKEEKQTLEVENGGARKDDDTDAEVDEKPIEPVAYSRIATVVELQENFNEDEIDKIDDKKKLRLKTDLRVSDLSMKIHDPTRTKSIYQKSELYLGISLLISIFYSLPVLQMVFSFSHSQRVTGNQDICYYNDLCRRPAAPFRDFNHVFSNLGYMVFGALFMFLVLLKKYKYQSFLKHNKTIQENSYGVPQQYGLYFSMGLALFMEGIMSGSYHICPTNVTFQFDTTFMYLLSILMFLKIYQIRHADVSANAVTVFFGLGISLILETISIFYHGPIFWGFFCTAYMIVIVVATIHSYNIGIVRYDYKILYNVGKILVLEVHKILKREPGHSILPRVRSRLMCLVVMASVNLTLCLYFGISGTSGASNYLLAIYILNLGMYFTYYCIMKIMHGEHINKVSTLYSTLSLICVVPALYFFTQKEKNSEVSPSESRMMNTDCIFLDFFDGHDIWHFLGGSGLFFSFLTILTIDEDVKYKKRENLYVF